MTNTSKSLTGTRITVKAFGLTYLGVVGRCFALDNGRLAYRVSFKVPVRDSKGQQKGSLVHTIEVAEETLARLLDNGNPVLY